MVPRAQHSYTFCELLDRAASAIARKFSGQRTRQLKRFSETHCHWTGSWHIVSFWQNVMRAFYVCGNDRHVKFGGKQGCTALECLHLTVLRSSALRIKDKTTAGLLHELLTSCQTSRKRPGSWVPIDRNDIHQRRDGPAQAARAKEIIAGADQSKTAKAPASSGHQGRAVGVTGMIAAEQKWSVRKKMSLLHSERTVPPEEGSTKTFETQTP